MQKLFKYLSLEQNGGLTNQYTNIAVSSAMHRG